MVAGSNPVSPTSEVAVPTCAYLRNRRTSNSPIAASRSPAAGFSARAAATIRSTTGSRARTTAAEPPTSHDTLNRSTSASSINRVLMVYGCAATRHHWCDHLVEKVATGLSLTEAVDVLKNVGSIEAEVRQQAYELGGTLVATLMK